MTDYNSSNTSFNKTGENFFLVGFMGSGKTHWGEKWSSANHLSFIDLDEQIEKKAGKTIPEIFETSGEDHFREIEKEVLRNCIQLQNTIIASGGGAPCFFDNMQWMNDHGTTIYINCTSNEIMQRVLSEQWRRPLLSKLTRHELQSFIENKLKEREPFYSQAKFTVQADRLTERSFAGILSTITS